MNTRIKNLVNDLAEARKNWDNDILNPNTHPLYKNITYYIAAQHADKVHTVDDIMAIYDNMTINAEIIDQDNIGEYEPETLARMIRERGSSKTVNQLRKDIANNYIYLFCYYLPGRAYAIDCLIKLEANYNRF